MHKSLQFHLREVRSPFPGFLRATTALHAASSAGAVAVVQRLLEARSAVAGGHGQLRALTPLHDAGTEEVALLPPGGDDWGSCGSKSVYMFPLGNPHGEK